MTTALPRIAIVDDSLFVLEAWQQLVDDAEVLVFESPRKFFLATSREPGLLASLACVVTDFHFDEGEPLDGTNFAALLVQRCGPPVLLSSDMPYGDEAGSPFAGRIAKEPMSWMQLARVLRRT